MRKHTNEQVMGKGSVLSCDVCHTEVGTNERLLRHVEREHAYQCPECADHFAKTADLYWHQQRAHADDSSSSGRQGPDPMAASAGEGTAQAPPLPEFPAQCSNCPSSDTVYQTAAEHEAHCREYHPFQCPICPRMLRQPSGIRRHFRTHHPKLKPYFCTSCALVFVSSVMVQSHECSGSLLGDDQMEGDKTIEEQLKDAPVAKPAESQVLKKEGYEEFVIPPLEVLLTWDIVTQMEPGDAVEEILAVIPAAPVKRKRTKKEKGNRGNQRTRDSMTQDETDVDGDDEELIKCKHCKGTKGETTFDTEKDLLEHISETHPFKCPDCTKPYHVVDSLRKHCRVTHGHDKISICRKCVLVFTDHGRGVEHKRSRHANDPRCAAPRTPKAVVNSRRHSEESEQNSPGVKAVQLYKCLYCREAYEKPHSLLKHSRTRHKKGLTTCRQCVRVFTDRATKLVHQKTKEHLDKVEQDSLENNEGEEEEEEEEVSVDGQEVDGVSYVYAEEEVMGEQKSQGTEFVFNFRPISSFFKYKVRRDLVSL